MNKISIKNVKALGLCSGGLDSILSALVLKRQGIDVTWISFTTPFFSSEKAESASARYGIPLIIQDISLIYLEMLKNPPGGYGQNLNPCLDCHSMMFTEAGRIMNSEGFDFLFSGDVAGQRPMSQTKQALRYIDKRSGFDGLILRPLSARILPESIPERSGLIDRAMLLDFNGRSRKPQMRLAAEMEVSEYPAPAGGCLLTDSLFSARLRHLMEYFPDSGINGYHMLRFGRHFMLDDSTKAVVGRDKADNTGLMTYYDPSFDLLLNVAEKPGPAVVVVCKSGHHAPESVRKAAVMCASYGKFRSGEQAEVQITLPCGKGIETVEVIACPPARFGDSII